MENVRSYSLNSWLQLPPLTSSISAQTPPYRSCPSVARLSVTHLMFVVWWTLTPLWTCEALRLSCRLCPRAAARTHTQHQLQTHLHFLSSVCCFKDEAPVCVFFDQRRQKKKVCFRNCRKPTNVLVLLTGSVVIFLSNYTFNQKKKIQMVWSLRKWIPYKELLCGMGNIFWRHPPLWRGSSHIKKKRHEKHSCFILLYPSSEGRHEVLSELTGPLLLVSCSLWNSFSLKGSVYKCNRTHVKSSGVKCYHTETALGLKWPFLMWIPASIIATHGEGTYHTWHKRLHCVHMQMWKQPFG